MDQQQASEPDANLVKALVRAHRIAQGEASGISDIARASDSIEPMPASVID